MAENDPRPTPIVHCDYSDDYIRDILASVKTIAMVGASENWNRPSYFAMKYLQQKGYRVIPVNPRAVGKEILGEPVYGDLAEIPVPVDMVDIFRASHAAGAFADITVFDPATVRDTASFEDPIRPAAGITHVFVNGRQVWGDGAVTGNRPGRALRHPPRAA